MYEKQKNYCSFIKVGKQEFMEKLFCDGEIYFNSLEYFRKLPQENNMSDPHEGIIKLIQTENIKIKVGDKTFFSDKGQLRITNPNLQGNMFCLYGIKTEIIEPTKIFKELNLDISSIDWGEAAVYIYDTKEFLKRMKSAIKKVQLQFKFHAVSYYDEKTYKGNLSIFDKSIKFKKQNEIRYWIPNATNKPIKYILATCQI